MHIPAILHHFPSILGLIAQLQVIAVQSFANHELLTFDNIVFNV